MNPIDIFIISVIVFFVIFSLFKKIHRNILSTIIVLLAFPGSYVFGKYIYSFVIKLNLNFLFKAIKIDADTIPEAIDFIKHQDQYKAFFDSSATLSKLVDSSSDMLIKLFSAFVAGFLIILFSSILAYILQIFLVPFISKRTRKKVKPIIGIPLAVVRGVAIAVFLLLPLVYLRPVVNELSNATTLDAQTEKQIKSYKYTMDNSYFMNTFGTNISNNLIVDTYKSYDESGNVVTNDLSDDLTSSVSLYVNAMPIINDVETLNTEPKNSEDLNNLINQTNDIIEASDKLYNNLPEDSKYRKIFVELIVSNLSNNDTILGEISIDSTQVSSLKEDLGRIVLSNIITNIINEHQLSFNIDLSKLSYSEIINVSKQISILLDN